MNGEAARDAADNLLRKAARALAADDEDRCATFVARAVALPYDVVEEMHPAAHAASMMLFTVVGDEADDGSPRWLDAALEVLPADAGWGRSELLATLRAIREDYELPVPDVAVLNDVLTTPPGRPELQDVKLPSHELAAAVTDVLNVVVDYVAVLESSG